MSKLRYALLAAACAGALAAVAALTLGTNAAQGGDRDHVSKDVRHMLDDVKAKNIEQTITTLVGFGTRHTLSTQTDPNRGIGAAHDLGVQPAAGVRGGLRRPDDGREADLHPAGGQPDPGADRDHERDRHPARAAARVGRPHVCRQRALDSRVTDVLNGTSDAPGADDDASGVAAVLELARVMSKHDFDATIVFAVFSGEEQGTFGSSTMRAGSRPPASTSPGCSRTTSSATRSARTACATGTTPRVRGGPSPRDAGAGRDPADDGRRERHASA